MRVIAGAFKGRRLATPTWPGLRPTSDRLRETLFNVVAANIPGARVLDAFAGTGALGLEALSRGAAHVTFVDRDRRAAALVAENARRCGLIADGGRRVPGEDRYAIIRADVRQALRELPAASFNLILLDPPYDVADLEPMLAAAGERLAPAGLLVLEHSKRRAAPETAGRLRRLRVLTSGDSVLHVYRLPADAPPGASAAG